MGSPTENGAVDNNVMLLVTALVCAALAALFLFVNKSFAETAPVAETPDTAATEEEVPENHKETKKKKKGALGLLKKNRQNQQAIQEQAANVEATNNNNDATNDDNDLADLTYDGDDFDELETAARGKVGAKKQMKLEAKAERQEAQKAMLKEREEKRAKDEELWQEELARRKEEEDTEKAEEAEILRKIVEQRAKEQAEYEAIKASGIFEVEDSGNTADDMAAESGTLLEDFVEFIKSTKIVMLEDLASKFRMKTKDAIARLKSLEDDGRITGVMDDRGKYIYVSESEMKAVVKFIKRRGRVSITELAENSHTLISLQGETTK